MALLMMREFEANAERLPKICMACGDFADQCDVEAFNWNPYAFMNLWRRDWALLAAAFTEYAIIDMPFCERHRSYFAQRRKWYWLIIGCALATWLIGSVIPAVFLQNSAEGIEYIFVGLCACLLVCVPIIAMIKYRSIRVLGIRRHRITLVNVDLDFVAAFNALPLVDEWDGDESDSDPSRPMPRRPVDRVPPAPPSYDHGLRAETPVGPNSGEQLDEET